MTPDPDNLPTIAEVKQAIFATRLPATIEAQMQTAIGERLTAAGYGHQREHDLGKGHGRIDFSMMTREGLLGIECKTRTSGMEAARQLHKYGQSPHDFATLVLVTTMPVQLPINAVASRGRMIPVEQWQIPAL